MMRRGIYTGHIEALRGKGALVKERDSKTVLAQFDDLDAVLGSGPLAWKLGYGWHEFPIRDFDVGVEWQP